MSHRNPDEARRILRCFEEAVPGLAMVRLRRVSLERRQGNVAGAEALLLEAVRANEGLPLASFYAVKLARHVCKVQRDLAKARQVLLGALEKDPENARLHANLLEMEFGADVRQNEGNTMSCFERALRSPLPDEAKLLFSQRRVEFLEDFGSSIHRYGLGGTPKNGGGTPKRENPKKYGETL
nr:pre-mRNA-processing factor 39-like [Anser cygnoides]